MNVIGIVMLTLMVAIISLILKRYTPEYSMVLVIAVSIFVFMLILKEIPPVVNRIKELISASHISQEYILILFKVMGVSFLTQFATDTCVGAGEVALASKLEFVGKISIVILALPLFEEVIKVVTKLLGV